jgi:hypothetical protein
MSVAGWKKKKQTAWMLLGAGITGVPLLLCVLFLGISHRNLRQELKGYKENAEQKTYSTAYCLKSEKKAGEVIETSDLEEILLSADKDSTLPEFQMQDLTGKAAKVDMAQGSIVSGILLADAADAGENIRVCTYSDIEYSADLTEGSFADIRISFPNGEDYIVVRHKQVQALGEEETLLTLGLQEAELLRLSSALVDKRIYQNTRVYAVAYRDNLQEASFITYPVNPQVYELTGWDPNVLVNDGVESTEGESRKETEIRRELEQNLAAYLTDRAGTAEAEEVGSTAVSAGTGSDREETDTEEFFP